MAMNNVSSTTTNVRLHTPPPHETCPQAGSIKSIRRSPEALRVAMGGWWISRRNDKIVNLRWNPLHLGWSFHVLCSFRSQTFSDWIDYTQRLSQSFYMLTWQWQWHISEHTSQQPLYPPGKVYRKCPVKVKI